MLAKEAFPGPVARLPQPENFKFRISQTLTGSGGSGAAVSRVSLPSILSTVAYRNVLPYCFLLSFMTLNYSRLSYNRSTYNYTLV